MMALSDGQVVMLVLCATVLVWVALALVVAAFEVKREDKATQTLPPPARGDYLLNAGPCDCRRCKARS